jgi:hypothetical protein
MKLGRFPDPVSMVAKITHLRDAVSAVQCDHGIARNVATDGEPQWVSARSEGVVQDT